MRVIRYAASGERARPQSEPLEGAVSAPETPPDEYGDKLVKYIPAEAIAFYLPAYSMVAADSTRTKASVFALGLVGSLIYLLARSDRSKMPRYYFYALAAGAFVCWAIGTSSVGQDLFGMSEGWSKITIMAAVFLIPAIDEVLTRFGV